MEIGIIGTGSVGTALAAGVSAAGHEVTLGSRDPKANARAPAPVESQSAAAAHGEVVILALPSSVIVDVAEEFRGNFAGKPVVDAANEYPTANADRPLARRVADAAPEARVVKAFNTIGANRMTSPSFDDTPATMFLAGDDAAAVETVGGLAADLGFEPVVAGDLDAAGHLEHLARFWIHLSRDHGRDIGFRLLRE